MKIKKHRSDLINAMVSEAHKSSAKLMNEVLQDIIVYGESITINFTCQSCGSEVSEIAQNPILCPKCKMTYKI